MTTLQNKIRSITLDFIRSGIVDDDASDQRLARIKFINLFSILTITIFLTFGLRHTIHNSLIVGLFELIGALFLLVNLFILRRYHCEGYASKSLLLILITISLLIFWQGGIGLTGNIWLLIVPIFLFFLLGKRGGKRAVLLYTLLLLALSLAMAQEWLASPWQWAQIRQTLIAYFCMLALAYYYESYKNSVQDGTERARRDLGNVISNMQDLYFRTDRGGRLTMLSPSVEQILGYRSEELLGQPITRIFVRATERRHFLASLQRNHGRLKDYESRILHADGHIVWLSTSSNYRYNDEGLLEGVEGISRDVTERRAFEEELAAKSDELSRINRELEVLIEAEVEKRRAQEQILFQQSRLALMGEMIAAIAHQWRQPLNSLGLTLQDLEDAYLEGEVTLDYLRRTIEDSMEKIEYMSVTIDDFRNFFLPSRNRLDFNLHESIKETLRILSHQISQSHTRQKLLLGDAPLLLFGYPNEFKQVLLILVHNSLEAIDDHRRRLADRTFEGELNITLVRYDDEDGERVELSIADNGGGIPADVRPNIFEPYFSTKKKENGTGIGLYLAQHIIVNNYGGQIVQQNIDNGCLFRLVLPVAGSTSAK